MKALVYKGDGIVAFEDHPRPTLAAEEALIRVAVCGVCGTDLKIVRGHYAVTPPRVLGHEFAGHVEAVGKSVRGIAPGDRVTVDPNLTCGACAHCRAGRTNLCPRITGIGVHRDGGFAEFAAVPARACHRVSDAVPLEEAAIAEPLSCAVHAVDRAGISSGDAVLVIGGGFAGQMIAQLARLRGASRVFLSTRSQVKRDLAAQLGASGVCAPEHAAKALEEATAGLGADVVIEAVGKIETLDLAIRCVRDGGRVVLYGVVDEAAAWSVRPHELLSREITLASAWLNPRTFAQAVTLLESRALTLAPLLAHCAPLAEGAALLSGQTPAEGPALKYLLAS